MTLRRALLFSIFSIWAGFFLRASPARAVDVTGILPAAMDQPMINFYISTTANGAPLSNPDGDPNWGLPFFNVTAYFDTGASGILLSYETAAYLSVPKSYSGGQLVIYEDVGVGGSEQFNVSQPLYIALAGIPSDDLDNPLTYQSVYTQKFGPVRLQIAKTAADLFPVDVVGIPAMAGKVIVMDPKPLDDIWSFDGIHTYVYNPGTPYRPATPDTDPGIPVTNHHIRLSYASFDSFTQVIPSTAAGPTLAQNPFIGPNPVSALYGGPPDDTPGVTISLGGLKTTGSFLFDTGAAASMISTALAAALHVRYVGGTQASGTLEMFDPARPGWSASIPNQFTLELGGIGGTVSATGFYLDSMLLRALEGNPLVDSDPNHIVFRNVPVLVNDITVQNPVTLQTLTLDGIFGMNNLVASFDTTTFDMATGNFNWIVFDQPNGILGLDLKASAASWTGGSNPASSSWKLDANWDGNKAPAAGYSLKFGNIAPSSVNNMNDFDAGTPFTGITFDGGTAFNLQGNRIELAGNVVNISTKAQTIGLDMTLVGAARSFIADSGDIVISGHIGGDQGLVKTGASKLVLKTTNTYSGSTTVGEGTLTLDGGTLANSYAISVANGATLEILGGTPTLSKISGQGTVFVAGLGTRLTSSGITANSLTIGVPAISAVWTGGGNPLSPQWTNPANWGGTALNPFNALIFGQSTPVSLNNTNDFTANTQFSGISFAGSSAFTLLGNRIALAGNVVNGSSQTQTIELDMQLAGAARVINAATADIIVGGQISGAQGLIKTGVGKLILKASNTYSGSTTVSQGKMILDGGDLDDASAIGLGNGASLEIIGGAPTLGNIAGHGTVKVIGVSTALTAGRLSVDSLVINTFVASSLWTGGGNPANPNWSNPANWGGTAPQSTNALIFGQSIPISVNNFNDFAPDTQFAGIAFSGGSSISLQGNRIALVGNVVNASSKPQTIQLDMQLAGAARIFNAAAADLVVVGRLSGTQGLIKTGAEDLILKTANTYAGSTAVNQGALILDGGDLADASAIGISSGASLKILAGTPTLGNITGKGNLTVTGLNTRLATPSISLNALAVSSTTPAGVPEPSMLVLLGISATAIFLAAKHRR
ncbi:MAG: autotransporter-associated beta strand repeat-containing protein [Pirellulales bacterium]|nr:autotransporter-associated beta strand repeat-containing protein [Pirellulales bacterium]